MKKVNPLTLVVFVIIISCTFLVYKELNANKVPFVPEIDHVAVITSSDDNNIEPIDLPVNDSEPFYGHAELDDETGDFIYGTWKIGDLIELGRKYEGTPESTWPPLEEIVGAEIILEEEYFSTMGINYKPMQFLREPKLYPYQNPDYCIEWIFYNDTSFYRYYKRDYPNSDVNDKIKVMHIDSPPNWGDINLTFIIVNNEKMFLIFDAMLFEMEKVIDK